MKHAIYIPTRQRVPWVIKGMHKLADALWENQLDGEVPVWVVTERQFEDDLDQILDSIPEWIPTDGLLINGADSGVGYARNAIVQHAHAQGYDSIAMIDDDRVVKGNIRSWLYVAAREDVTSVGAYKSIYGLLCGGTQMVQDVKAKQPPGVYLHKGSIGNEAVALNVANVIALGNYDPDLTHFEDHELCRNNYEQRGAPWFIYTGVTFGDILPEREMRSIGGITSIGDRPAHKAKAHSIVAERWPEYVTAPPKQYRCSWKRLVQDFIGEISGPLENIRTYEPWDWE